MFALCCDAANIRFAFTNSVNQPDTNFFRVYPISTPIRADGGYSINGVGLRLTPAANGTLTTNLARGNYMVTNSFGVNPYTGQVGWAMLISVPEDQTATIYKFLQSGIAISGFNVFNYTPGVNTLVGTNGIVVTNDGAGQWRIDGSNSAPTSAQITNAIGFMPLTPAQTTNLVVASTNKLADTNYVVSKIQTATNNLLFTVTNIANAAAQAATNNFTVGSTSSTNLSGNALVQVTNVANSAALSATQSLATVLTHYQRTEFDTNNNATARGVVTNIANAAASAATNTLNSGIGTLLVSATNHLQRNSLTTNNEALARDVITNIANSAVLAGTNDAASAFLAAIQSSTNHYQRNELDTNNNAVARGVITNVVNARVIAATNNLPSSNFVFSLVQSATNGLSGGGAASSNQVNMNFSGVITSSIAVIKTLTATTVSGGSALGLSNVSTTNLVGKLPNERLNSNVLTNKYPVGLLQGLMLENAPTTFSHLALTNQDFGRIDVLMLGEAANVGSYDYPVGSMAIDSVTPGLWIKYGAGIGQWAQFPFSVSGASQTFDGFSYTNLQSTNLVGTIPTNLIAASIARRVDATNAAITVAQSATNHYIRNEFDTNVNAVARGVVTNIANSAALAATNGIGAAFQFASIALTNLAGGTNIYVGKILLATETTNSLAVDGGANADANGTFQWAGGNPGRYTNNAGVIYTNNGLLWQLLSGTTTLYTSGNITNESPTNVSGGNPPPTIRYGYTISGNGGVVSGFVNSSNINDRINREVRTATNALLVTMTNIAGSQTNFVVKNEFTTNNNATARNIVTNIANAAHINAALLSSTNINGNLYGDVVSVNSVTATNGISTPVLSAGSLSITNPTYAGSGTNGFLGSNDWSSFNSKMTAAQTTNASGQVFTNLLDPDIFLLSDGRAVTNTQSYVPLGIVDGNVLSFATQLRSQGITNIFVNSNRIFGGSSPIIVWSNGVWELTNSGAAAPFYIKVGGGNGPSATVWASNLLTHVMIRNSTGSLVITNSSFDSTNAWRLQAPASGAVTNFSAMFGRVLDLQNWEMIGDRYSDTNLFKQTNFDRALNIKSNIVLNGGGPMMFTPTAAITVFGSNYTANMLDLFGSGTFYFRVTSGAGLNFNGSMILANPASVNRSATSLGATASSMMNVEPDVPYGFMLPNASGEHLMMIWDDQFNNSIATNIYWQQAMVFFDITSEFSNARKQSVFNWLSQSNWPGPVTRWIETDDQNRTNGMWGLRMTNSTLGFGAISPWTGYTGSEFAGGFIPAWTVDTNGVTYINRTNATGTSSYVVPIIQAGRTNVTTATSVIIRFANYMPNTNYVATATAGGAALVAYFPSAQTVSNFTANFTIISGEVEWTAIQMTQ